MKRIAILALAAFVGLLAWQAMAGQDTTVPDAPSVGVPSIGNPQDLANDAADGVEKMPPWVWKFAVPLGLVALVLASVKKKHPVLFWMGAGVLVAGVVFYASKGGA